MQLDNTRYREELRRQRKWYYRHYHYCSKCGYYSKTRLVYGHPYKEGMICSKCRDIMYNDD